MASVRRVTKVKPIPKKNIILLGWEESLEEQLKKDEKLKQVFDVPSDPLPESSAEEDSDAGSNDENDETDEVEEDEEEDDGVEAEENSEYELEPLKKMQEEKLLDMELIEELYKNHYGFVVYGCIIRASETMRELLSKGLADGSFINIFSSSTFVLDEDMDFTGRSITLSIVAPKLLITAKNAGIYLDGVTPSSDNEYNNRRVPESTIGIALSMLELGVTIWKGKSKPEPGTHGVGGGHAGNFFAIFGYVEGKYDVNLTANGGDGSPGWDGAEGKEGKRGVDFKVTDLPDANDLTAILRQGKQITGGINVLLYSVDRYKFPGTPGEVGRKGKQGGGGGKGGDSGNIKVVVQKDGLDKIRKFRCPGQGGEGGEGGDGGIGGVNGRSYQVERTSFVAGYSWRSGEFKGEGRAADGETGKSGGRGNPGGRKKPMNFDFMAGLRMEYIKGMELMNVKNQELEEFIQYLK